MLLVQTLVDIRLLLLVVNLKKHFICHSCLYLLFTYYFFRCWRMQLDAIFLPPHADDREGKHLVSHACFSQTLWDAHSSCFFVLFVSSDGKTSVEARVCLLAMWKHFRFLRADVIRGCFNCPLLWNSKHLPLLFVSVVFLQHFWDLPFLCDQRSWPLKSCCQSASYWLCSSSLLGVEDCRRWNEGNEY